MSELSPLHILFATRKGTFMQDRCHLPSEGSLKQMGKIKGNMQYISAIHIFSYFILTFTLRLCCTEIPNSFISPAPLSMDYRTPALMFWGQG